MQGVGEGKEKEETRVRGVKGEDEEGKKDKKETEMKME